MWQYVSPLDLLKMAIAVAAIWIAFSLLVMLFRGRRF